MYNKYFCSCGGNPNNYLTEDECLTTCTEDTGSGTTVRPQGEAKDPQEVRERDDAEIGCHRVRAQVCAMLPEAGSCTKQVTRYYFSPKDGACDSFVWSGCKVTSYWPLDTNTDL